ncbi:MAG TPA: HAD family phosphatase [Candidatus Angelobacter sp.]|nr:HAD family phosphatase [Candidatus Angelobacter sp.]
MLQGVIFDLDGVLVDSHPVHLRAWKALFASLNRHFSESELQFIVEGHKREEILRHFLGHLSEEQIREYGAYKEALVQASAQEIKAVRGVPEFLSEIQRAGLPMGVASSAGRMRVESTLERLHLKPYFSAVMTGSDVAKGKPDPAIFCRTAEAMGLGPSGILVCEDAVSGVQAAKSAEMMCLGIAAPERALLLHQAGADRIVLDFSELRLDDLRGLFLQMRVAKEGSRGDISHGPGCPPPFAGREV